jgi:hypothetical protein
VTRISIVPCVLHSNVGATKTPPPTGHPALALRRVFAVRPQSHGDKRAARSRAAGDWLTGARVTSREYPILIVFGLTAVDALTLACSQDLQAARWERSSVCRSSVVFLLSLRAVHGAALSELSSAASAGTSDWRSRETR